ncbi:MAG TPA: hypothetical protein PLS74_09400, partial [Bacteroidales bacterium]|nr:hypothetical protein [Bacteroidales bacterium]
MKISSLFLLFVLFLFSSCSEKRLTYPEAVINGDSILIENIFPYQTQHCHASTIVELPDHDLLVAWFQGSGERTAEDVVIMGARYNRKTGKWSEPFLMADTDGFPD